MSPVPVVTLASLDPVLREAAADGLLCDLSDAVVVRHDLIIHVAGDSSGHLRRVVYDRTCVYEDVLLPLEHACLSCALREDILPVLDRLARTPVGAVVLALPVAAEPLTVVRTIAERDPSRLRAANTVTVLDAGTLERDLLGDDLLHERGLPVGGEDRRAVGEVLAHQVEFSDVLLTPVPAQDRAGALLDHLLSRGARRQLLHEVDADSLLGAPIAGPVVHRGDPRRVEPTGHGDRAGVWTVDLRSWRPMHPQRLFDSLPALGSGPWRGRGHIWLPSRPHVAVAWDGAGGQLSIGGIGSWGPDVPTSEQTEAALDGFSEPAHVREGALTRGSRLVVTGAGGDPNALRATFESALVTERELARGLDWWAARPDGFDDWLGEQVEAA